MRWKSQNSNDALPSHAAPAGPQEQDHPEVSTSVSCERGRIPGAKGEASLANDLHECSEIGRDDRQFSPHIFRDDQAKDFAAQGGNHNCGSVRKRGLEFASARRPANRTCPASGAACERRSSEARSGPSPNRADRMSRFCSRKRRAASNNMPTPFVVTSRP